MPTVIQLHNITKTYGSDESATNVLRGVDVSIQAGEMVAIVGPSGSGKSTLMHILGLLDSPTGGSYHLDGRPVAGLNDRQLAKLRRQKIGFVFQSFNLLPRLTAVQNLELPMTYDGKGRKLRHQEALALMDRVGLLDHANYRPNQLSGGQVQRVAVARALANHPSLILADEPTGNLDTVSSQSVMDLLSQLNQDGTTVVLVTHNPDIAAQAGRTITLRDGQIVGGDHAV